MITVDPMPILAQAIADARQRRAIAARAYAEAVAEVRALEGYYLALMQALEEAGGAAHNDEAPDPR